MHCGFVCGLDTVVYAHQSRAEVQYSKHLSHEVTYRSKGSVKTLCSCILVESATDHPYQDAQPIGPRKGATINACATSVSVRRKAQVLTHLVVGFFLARSG